MIIYRKATIDDMDEVASVHVHTQPEYFTSTLGTDLLSKFYTEFLTEDNLFVVAVDETTSRIVGFCMGNYYGSNAEKRWEEKYRNEIIARLLLKCVQLNRLAISRVFRRIKSKLIKSQNKRPDVYFSHLLSLGVLTEYRGHHIASTLIDEFEYQCLHGSHPKVIPEAKTCTIGAYKWNTAGCKLYAYKGYIVYEEEKEKLKFKKNLLPDRTIV